ncbi:MAG: HAD-IIA family hydrolase [Anaerolineales bacterium]|nr:MAG: HAD-IIA family hydrolase [Anaerolineales bacterium]
MTVENIKNTACFLFDLDGTIYLGDQLLPGAADTLAYLDEIGKPYFFLTNNSSRSRADYVKKMAKYGLEVKEEKIFSSGMATAIYLLKEKPAARVYLVGTPSLEEEFRAYGFQLVEEDPDYVVLGFDTTLTYDKIRRLCDFVVAGKPYLATHPDINCPTPEGFMPDIGAMMAMIQASTGRKADVIVGKPHPPMVEAIESLTGFQSQNLTMVGDRLYTDIAMGAAGIQTVLVLSGETKIEDLPDAPHQPDLVCENLGALLVYLRGE